MTGLSHRRTLHCRPSKNVLYCLCKLLLLPGTRTRLGWVPVFAYRFPCLHLLNENPEVFPLSRSKTRLRPGSGGIVPRFGAAVEKLTPQNPARARLLFLTGLRAQAARLAIAPRPPAGQGLAVRRPGLDGRHHPPAVPRRELGHRQCLFSPASCCRRSASIRCSPRGLSCYLNGAWAEKYYLRTAEEAGVSSNFCSYHKALLGGRIDRPDPQAGFHRLHLPGLRRQQPDLPAAGPAL